MIILGIDPGTQYTGYGVIDVEAGAERLVEYGVLRLDAQKSHPLRLKHIYDRLTQVIERCLPDECALEMPVYGRNPQSMLKLGRAQAAAMLAVLNRGIPARQYTPKEVKKAVTGNGNASKEQVRYMVCSILRLTGDGSGDGTGDATTMGLDASDALAVALCHAHRGPEASRPGYSGWEAFLRANPDRMK